MKRRGPKRLIKVKDNISFVHLNVKSGYISYIEVPSEESRPRVKGVLLHGKDKKVDVTQS
ncbi:MAG: hypothetical protein ACE5QF_02950 [Thermoplasmata archaeon]